jgi:hypothetical protein
MPDAAGFFVDFPTAVIPIGNVQRAIGRDAEHHRAKIARITGLDERCIGLD